MINLPEGHFPVTHPALRARYLRLRAAWLNRLFWTSQGIRSQMLGGPDHSCLGANLAQDAAAIAYIEGEINALVSANIALEEGEEPQSSIIGEDRR